MGSTSGQRKSKAIDFSARARKISKRTEYTITPNEANTLQEPTDIETVADAIGVNPDTFRRKYQRWAQAHPDAPVYGKFGNNGMHIAPIDALDFLSQEDSRFGDMRVLWGFGYFGFIIDADTRNPKTEGTRIVAILKEMPNEAASGSATSTPSIEAIVGGNGSKGVRTREAELPTALTHGHPTPPYKPESAESRSPTSEIMPAQTEYKPPTVEPHAQPNITKAPQTLTIEPAKGTEAPAVMAAAAALNYKPAAPAAEEKPKAAEPQPAQTQIPQQPAPALQPQEQPIRSPDLEARLAYIRTHIKFDEQNPTKTYGIVVEPECAARILGIPDGALNRLFDYAKIKGGMLRSPSPKSMALVDILIEVAHAQKGDEPLQVLQALKIEAGAYEVAGRMLKDIAAQVDREQDYTHYERLTKHQVAVVLDKTIHYVNTTLLDDSPIRRDLDYDAPTKTVGREALAQAIIKHGAKQFGIEDASFLEKALRRLGHNIKEDMKRYEEEQKRTSVKAGYIGVYELIARGVDGFPQRQTYAQRLRDTFDESAQLQGETHRNGGIYTVENQMVVSFSQKLGERTGLSGREINKLKENIRKSVWG